MFLILCCNNRNIAEIWTQRRKARKEGFDVGESMLGGKKFEVCLKI